MAPIRTISLPFHFFYIFCFTISALALSGCGSAPALPDASDAVEALSFADAAEDLDIPVYADNATTESALEAMGLNSSAGALSVGSEVAHPDGLSVWMKLKRRPAHSVFTRYLTFTNMAGDTKRVAIRFTKESRLKWRGELDDASDLLRLKSLAETGNRSYWDSMKLENRGGSTRLRIKHLFVQVNYSSIPATRVQEIPLIDYELNETLSAGYDSIDLADAAAMSRMAFARAHAGSDGLYPIFPEHVRLAINDLGKSGSSGSIESLPVIALDAKYGDADRLLCSEFVSWYYHAAGVELSVDVPLPWSSSSATVVVEDFRDITATQQMHDSFHRVHGLYSYHNGRKRFENTHGGEVYTPKAGDFLEWRKNGKAMHSMILFDWNDETKIATVINGPWPVTFRTVKIQKIEEMTEYDGESIDYDFYIGRVNPGLSFLSVSTL